MFAEKLQAILSDNLSGSGTILHKFRNWLMEYAESTPFPDRKGLFEAIDAIMLQFPFFGLVLHFGNELKQAVSGKSMSGSELANWLKAYEKRWEHAQEKTSRALLAKIELSGKNVLLHSNSSSIQNLFSLLKEGIDNPILWQTYSSPAGEGCRQAEILAGMGFHVKLIHEDSATKFIQKVDFALFGADLITKDHFINKTGTLALCLAMKHVHKPVYLIAEQRKITDTDVTIPAWCETLKPVSEIYIPENPNIEVINNYFEEIPMDLITEIFLDK